MQSHRHFLALINHNTHQYWSGQAIFWFCLSLVPFLGMVLWYNTTQWIYILHMLLQAGMGLLLSIPLGWCYTRIWSVNTVARMCAILLLAALTAAIWTALRIATYIWLTAEAETWGEFGGWYFGAYYIFLFWSALFHGVIYYRLLEVEHAERLKEIAHTKEEQIKRLKAESIAREAQLKMLRYQINPHFLFNTLHAIYALIRLSESKKALEMIAKLGKFLRYSLEYDPRLQVNLDDEINTLILYINIEKVRFSDRLTVNYEISDAAKTAKIPSLLLQPLIENAIKYAIATSEAGGTITIRAETINDKLLLEVIDNGPGLAGAIALPEQSSGVGLRNTRERLQTLFGDDHSFSLQAAEPSGVRVSIVIPYESVQSDTPATPHKKTYNFAE